MSTYPSSVVSSLRYVSSDVEGECTLRKITPVRFNPAKFGIFVLLCLLSGGILLLFVHWYSCRHLGILVSNNFSTTIKSILSRPPT
jgi:hypothetical protein